MADEFFYNVKFTIYHNVEDVRALPLGDFRSLRSYEDAGALPLDLYCFYYCL